MSEETEVNEKEQQALALGWKPKDDFEGDEGDWVDHNEFLRRGELFDAIHKSNRKVKKLEEQLAVLGEHHKKTAEVAYEKALEELKREKKEAARDGDVERIVAIDEEIEVVKEKKTAATAAQTTESTPYDEWADKNSSWYETDELLTSFAIGYGGKLERANPSWAQEKVLSEVEKKVKETFPEKFGNPNRSKPSSVASSSSTQGSKTSKNKLSYKDLPEEAQNIYRKLVKTSSNPNGPLTEEQYLKDYALAAGLEYGE